MSLYLSSRPRRISTSSLTTRSSDFPYFVPSQIANCAGWWDASRSGTLFDATSGGSAVAADGAVARWEDCSGNSNHATQSTSNNRPLRRTAKINSLDALDFDGTNDSFSLTTNLDASAYTCFVVGKKATGTDTLIVFGQATTFLPYVLADIGGTGTYGSKATTGGNGAFAGNTTQLLNRTTAFLASQDSSVPRIWIDGAAQALASTGTGAAGTQFTAMGVRTGGSSIYAKATFGEVVFYSRVLTDLERTTVENYLRKKWGTT